MSGFYNLIYSKDDSGKRIKYLDLAKGVCIFGIMTMHLTLTLPLDVYFAMPLFFFLSGLFFKDIGVKQTLIRKINVLIIPLIFFNLVGEAYHFLEVKYTTADVAEFEPLKAALYIKNSNAPVWFLMALFIDNMLMLAITRAVKHKIIQGCTVLVIVGISVLFNFNAGNHFALRSAILALPFFYGGYLMRDASSLRNDERPHYLLALGALLTLLGCVIFTQRVDASALIFHNATFHGNPIIFYTLSFVCIAALIVLCKFVGWLPVISFMGVYSLIIMGTHLLLQNFLAHIFEKFLGITMLTQCCMLLIEVIICILLIYPLVKYLPMLVGKKHLIKK